MAWLERFKELVRALLLWMEIKKFNWNLKVFSSFLKQKILVLLLLAFFKISFSFFYNAL